MPTPATPRRSPARGSAEWTCRCCRGERLLPRAGEAGAARSPPRRRAGGRPPAAGRRRRGGAARSLPPLARRAAGARAAHRRSDPRPGRGRPRVGVGRRPRRARIPGRVEAGNPAGLRSPVGRPAGGGRHRRVRSGQTGGHAGRAAGGVRPAGAHRERRRGEGPARPPADRSGRRAGRLGGGGVAPRAARGDPALRIQLSRQFQRRDAPRHPSSRPEPAALAGGRRSELRDRCPAVRQPWPGSLDSGRRCGAGLGGSRSGDPAASPGAGGGKVSSGRAAFALAAGGPPGLGGDRSRAAVGRRAALPQLRAGRRRAGARASSRAPRGSRGDRRSHRSGSGRRRPGAGLRRPGRRIGRRGGAALCDQPFLAVPLLLAGGAAAALYAEPRRLREAAGLTGLILMSAFAAAGSWETAYRLRLREYAGGELLARLSPPTREEIASVSREISGYFETLDLAKVVPRVPAGLERQDLAYALWRDSPLARHHSLSALVVQTADSPAASSFSFGMPLTDQGLVDPDPGRWEDLRLPLWEDLLISGVVPLRVGGRPWARVRYWLVPRPGFEVHGWQRLSEVDVGLLRGGPVAGPVEEIAQPALYALYTPDGRASLSPWEEEPPLSTRLRRAAGGLTRALVETPAGPARAWARLSSQGWEVVYLPLLRPLDALERTGNWSVGVVILLALAAPPILLLALPRAAFRDLLRRTVRSYSKRLMIVYTVLLLVPLMLLYLVLVRSIQERLHRDQQAAGEAALNSAQQVLGERLLTLPPGFGVDTAFGDRLL